MLGVTIEEPGDGETLTDNTPTVSGTSEPGASITVVVDGKTYETTADENGDWSVDVDPLDDGD